MNKRLMPQALAMERPKGVQWDITPQALERWSPNLMLAPAAEDREKQTASISILDPIGADFWTGEGVTAKRIAGALRSIGEGNDVVVNLNSPGGDLFEGMAIYNLLREHKGNVTIKVLGLAASAASIIAMAGDEVQIARAGFFMVHNSWIAASGNRHDMREFADRMEPFDFAMADIYAARTGLDMKAIGKKMDAETWVNGSAAVDEGWADSLLPSDLIEEGKNARATAERAAPYLIDMAMAKAGMARSERRSLMQEFKASMLRAAGHQTGMPRATEQEGTPRAAEANAFIESIRSIKVQEILQ